MAKNLCDLTCMTATDNAAVNMSGESKQFGFVACLFLNQPLGVGRIHQRSCRSESVVALCGGGDV